MRPNHPAIDETTLQAYYARDLERDRLTTGVGRVEFLRTVEVASRVLPSVPATVADVGGGPGRYTDHLLTEGYRMAHRDLVAHHVDQVRARHPRGTPRGDRLEAMVADARALDLADDSVDAVLLLGPLYHLVERDDRIHALREAGRVVRPGGPVVAAAISRWAARLGGMLTDRVHLELPAIVDEVGRIEETGRMPPLRDGAFNGYTHRPDDLVAEAEAAGLEVESLVGVEGVATVLGDADIEGRLGDPAERALLLDTLRATEAVPELLGVSAHLLVTARAPG